MNNLVDSILEFIPYGTDLWKKTGKLKFEYSGNKITRLVHYGYSSNTYTQDKVTTYSYSGGNITSIVSDDYLETFQYDQRGNLKSRDDGNYYFPVKTFQYEAGTGNYSFIKYLGDPLLTFEQYPPSVCVP